MLGGEDFGGCHEAGLTAIVQCQEHAHECYEGLAAADVALDEPVHLVAGTHILSYFFNYTLLGSSEGERELGIESVEAVAHMVEYAPLGVLLSLVVSPLVVELEKE